jgi:hypothetical protein
MAIGGDYDSMVNDGIGSKQTTMKTSQSDERLIGLAIAVVEE